MKVRRIAQIARAAGLPGNLRINYHHIITEAMLRIRPRQPGKPERALQQTKWGLVRRPVVGRFGAFAIGPRSPRRLMRTVGQKRPVDRVIWIVNKRSTPVAHAFRCFRMNLTQHFCNEPSALRSSFSLTSR